MGKNKRINDLDKLRLFKCHQDGRDFHALAGDLGIKISSSTNIIRTMQRRNGVASLPSGGAHHTKMDNEMKKEIEEIIGEYPTMTIKDINLTLQARLPNKVKVSDTCITKNIDGMLFSMKKVVNQPAERNSYSTKLARREYVSWYLGNAFKATTIFIDEAGCNLWTHRSRGRSKIGLPAVRVVGGQRGKNLSIILATSDTAGMVYATMDFGGTTKERFQSFIYNLNVILSDVKNVIFIMDNASCHSNVISNNEEHKIKHLPVYSPALNPVEEAFSCWKYALKAKLDANQVRVMDYVSSAAAGKSMMEWRSDILKECALESLNVITPEKCTKWHSHMIEMLGRANNMEDI